MRHLGYPSEQEEDINQSFKHNIVITSITNQSEIHKFSVRHNFVYTVANLIKYKGACLVLKYFLYSQFIVDGDVYSQLAYLSNTNISSNGSFAIVGALLYKYCAYKS